MFVGNLNNPNHTRELYKAFNIKDHNNRYNVSEKVVDEKIVHEQLPDNYNELDYIIYNHFNQVKNN